MGRLVTIPQGYDEVYLPNGTVLNGGQSALISEAVYVAIKDTFGKNLTFGSQVADPVLPVNLVDAIQSVTDPTFISALSSAFVKRSAAKADGTDYSTTLQSEADALALLGGGRLVLPSGTVIGHVSVDASVVVVGEGVDATVLMRPATWDGPVVQSKNFAAMIASGGDGTTHDMGCMDLTIDGNRSAGGFTAPLAGTIPATPTASTSTAGGTIAAGTQWYRVAPLNACGEAPSSEPVSQVTTGSTSTVTLTWAPVTGATGYVIYGRVYNGTRIVTVGNVTTWTDNGSLTPGVNLNFRRSANPTSPSAIALYGWKPVLRNVSVKNSPGAGVHTAWYTTSGLPSTGLSLEAKLMNVSIEYSGTNSLIWEGPHDSTFLNLMAARPGQASGVNVADVDNVVVEGGGPVRFITSHPWGQAKRAWALWGQADLTACQAEGALTAQVLAPCPQTHILGLEVFFPGSASAKGLVFNDPTRNSASISQVAVRGLHAHGFSSASGAAVDLSNVGSGCTIEGVIDQTTGTAITGSAPTTSHVNLRVNGMAGGIFQVPGYSLQSGTDVGALLRNAGVYTATRRESSGALNGFSSGIVAGGLAVCQVAGTYTQARLFFTGVGSGVTSAKVGVYSSTGALVSTSADFSAAITASGANTWVTVTLGASLTMAAGDQVFLAFAEAHSTTSVGVRALIGATNSNFWPQTTADGVIPYRGKSGGSFTGTTLPAQIDVNGGPGQIPLIELIP